MTADPMHQKLIRRAQRHATEARAAQVTHRLDSLEADVTGLSAQIVADSIVLGTSSLQQAPGVISAETRRSDEAACAALAELIWTPAERLAFHAMRADADGAA